MTTFKSLSSAHRWLGLWLLGVFVLCSAFVLQSPHAPAPAANSFKVAEKDGRITRDTQATLLRFYRAIYGSQAEVSAIEIVPVKGVYYLAFQGTSAKSPTMTVTLTATRDGFIINAASKKNTCSGDPCSGCAFKKNEGCVCYDNGFCNHKGTGIIGDLDKPAEVLGIGL